MNVPIALPVRLTSEVAGEGTHEIAVRSVENIAQFLEAGGSGMNLSSEWGRLRGFQMRNVLILAQLFLQEHPSWPEEDA